MSIKIVREKRKNADGSYDIIHPETQAKVVWFEDGESFQQKYDSGELTGPAGADGKDGETGPAGANGITPVKGTDYWTSADKAEIVQEVLNALPNASGVNF